MSIIPKVQEFINAQVKKDQAQLVAFQKSEERKKKRFEDASREMVVDLTDKLVKAMKVVKTSTSAARRVELREFNLGTYKGLPGDVLLYGHRTDDWCVREDAGLEVPTFRRLQAEFFDAGWYLIEESDPSKSRAFVFALYGQKPKGKHPYFNHEGRLWHYHNMFSEEKLNELIEKLKAEKEAERQEKLKATEQAESDKELVGCIPDEVEDKEENADSADDDMPDLVDVGEALSASS